MVGSGAVGAARAAATGRATSRTRGSGGRRSRRRAREALRGVAPERVRGVATCATSGTVLLVDRAGEPLTPGLMYDDARASEHAERAAAALGRPIGASWGLAKLLWMLDEWPGLARGARLAHQADVVTRRLAGHDVPSDSSHALKSGYDVEREAWPAARRRRPGCCPTSCAAARGSARSASAPPRRPRSPPGRR